MDYFVRRGEQEFGPYTLAELQEYVQSGRVLAGDLAKSEGLADWLPVSQILGNIPAPPVAAAVTAAPPPDLVPLAPNLHWGILLLLVVLTRQFFNWIWAFVLANWARKLTGNNKPMVLVAMYPAGFLTGMLVILFGAATHSEITAAVGGICILAGAIVYIFGIFKIRDAMEEYYNSCENIGLVLSGVMTFFFSSVYLQYHVNRIARWKKTGVLS
ncbi:MAG: hypothetical protein PVS2B2_00840 [Candidatus Acidiferrum sp.]